MGGGGGAPLLNPGIRAFSVPGRGGGGGGGGPLNLVSDSITSSSGVFGVSDSMLGCEGPVVTPSSPLSELISSNSISSSSSDAPILLTLEASSPNRLLACASLILGFVYCINLGRSIMYGSSSSSLSSTIPSL
jgi:hypothetical protein